MYYKAVVYLSSETMKDGFGTDEYFDQGEINNYTAPGIRELFAKIARQYDLHKFETFENRLECSIEVNDRDGSRVEYYSIYITGVEETDLFQSTLSDFLKEFTNEQK